MSVNIKIIIVDADSGHTVSTLNRKFTNESTAKDAADDIRETIDTYCIVEEE